MEDRFQLLTANIAKMSRYIKRIKSEEMADIQQHMMGCTIGTHIGPGAFGIVYFEK